MASSPTSPDSAQTQDRAWRRFSLFRRLSTSSLNTLSSARSAQSSLPEYSPFDSNFPSAFPLESEADTADCDISYVASGSVSREPNLSVEGINIDDPSGPSRVPPQYSGILTAPLSLPTAGPDDGAPKKVAHIEHSFPIRANKPWATLLIFTRNSIPGLSVEKRVRKVPRFVGDGMVSGMVELDLESTQTIQAISVTLRGKIVTGYLADEAITFLDHKHVIWNTKSMGNPPTSSKSRNVYHGKKAAGKLLGSYQIPFNFPFPSLIDFQSYDAVLPEAVSPFSLASPASAISSSNDSPWANSDKKTPLGSPTNTAHLLEGRPGVSTQSHHVAVQADNRGKNDSICPAPPSFVETGVTACVQYELIKTPVSYIPSVKALPVSMKRKEAYRNGAIPPGPERDAEGWFALPKASIVGWLGGSRGRPLSVDCVLHIAHPLIYTRGAFIPCHLTYTGDDSDALTALCKPSSPNVHLVRRLRHFCPKGGDALPEHHEDRTRTTHNPEGFGGGSTNTWYAVLPPPAMGGKSKGSSLKTVRSEVGKAVWWKPPKDAPSELYTSYMSGELHLPMDMQPCCNCPVLQIEYFIEMLPPTVPTFEYKDGEDCVLASHPVQVATFHSLDSPFPVPFTRPSEPGTRSGPLE
ncbi:hypothetical protein D9613_003991 [Agrocybe pediades]|uniref:Arrestin-like N-terminal domain-containing protein n=1 Tax=Agrocybe pediades TaxID=84607 RepID=A0A8H4VIK7_9AGAR|nr:hypothetical protein D9613_003991 [Agrocybe pediades]